MAVQVWIGEKPEHPQERRAILGVAQALEKLEGLFLILANFSVNGRNIDLVIIKHNAIVIIELKHCDGRVIGSVNGPWFVEGRNGEQKRLNPGRKNPYNQVISYFHALTNFLNEHRREFLSEQKANDVDFRTCKRLIVIAPRIEEGSQLDLDWKVEVRGLDELTAYMITERSSEIELSEEEMLAIPKLLHCTPWTELNEVVRENAPPAPTKSVPLPWYVQARNALHTTAGRLVTIFAGLSLVLLFILFVRPPSPAPRADSPLTSITMGTSGDGTILNFNATTSFCRWNGYQLIGKRWDSSTQSWQNIAIGEATTGAAPDIIVALEQIDACGDRIEITWSVQNNTNRSVSFPLRHNNIKISDGLGNDYPLANDDSRPAVINVLPGTRQRGVAVVRRQLAANASTLRIKLIEQPFGEASFIVALQP
ncbi:nuclease-related domain-containing protein [Chloroflexus sp. MS-G]|uniref:nuclease-related domain-containing protein n=1 Tax=Chloroflexus sp. MS-G TaxID=1521187 RepID=UPI0004DF1A30|nr:nuclease-related domain-containing protein [Chloroflexus sp. MS-G]